jgi:ArsR family transcriptional regulator, arsenate/arsenite/antimonite-responsive transcriptional repressor
MVMKHSNMARIFKALSNDQRLKIFMMIYENQGANISDDVSTCKCTCGLNKAFTKACDYLKLSRSTISHHLKELQNAGLIKCDRIGQSFNCVVNEEIVDSIRDFLK